MFIRWREYNRQSGGYYTDKYFMQPILMQSYRVPGDRNPKQRQVYRFPRFPSCDYVYYRSPEHIRNRMLYWVFLEMRLENRAELKDLPEKTKQKIRDEIETILPKPYGELLEIMKKAIDEGMPAL